MIQEFVLGMALNQVKMLFHFTVSTLIVAAPYVALGIVALTLVGALVYHITKKKS